MQTNFSLVQHHKYSLTELENMMPWEREVYVIMLVEHLKEEGHSCWSVKNIKTDKSYPLYDDIVRLHEEKGWRIIDREFYISNCLRPGLKDTNGNSMKSKESTFVFMKI